MNERIKELAEKADEYAADYEFKNGGDEFNVFKEKFAELIVKECCDWIDGSPANDAGQLHLTKSFIIANLKGMFRGSKE